MAEIDVLKAQLVRDDANTPWGFRLQGGAEHACPLTIDRIRPGSPADRIGLRQGDEVTEIGDTSTANLSHERANDVIKQYGLSLILTIERRAKGTATAAPHVIQTTAPPQPPTYQPYDMSGRGAPAHYAPVRSAPQPAPVATYPNIEYHTAKARVFDPPPTVGPRYQPPPTPPQPEPQPQLQPETYGPPRPMDMSDYDAQYEYLPEEEKLGGPVQSRTFKVLQSLMENEEPYAGTAGLPPPRSASAEQWRREQMAKRESPRVKVLMPQSYNTPLGLYNTENIMDSFQQQAGAHLDQLDDQYEADPLSGAQRAVLEEEFVPGGSDL